MAFKILVSPRALIEIEDALDYYCLNSLEAPKQFLKSIQDAYLSLQLNPFLEIKYNSIRSIRIRKFPYSFYFTINEELGIIRILSCFHHKLNPRKRPI
jgi:plasmid stabilization system protein ParE